MIPSADAEESIFDYGISQFESLKTSDTQPDYLRAKRLFPEAQITLYTIKEDRLEPVLVRPTSEVEAILKTLQ